VVDQDVQRAVPARGERLDGLELGELEVLHGRGADLGRDALARGDVADGERDLRAGAGQRAGGLDPDAGRAAGDDRAPAGETDPLDDLRRGRLKAETGHRVTPPCAATARPSQRSQLSSRFSYSVRIMSSVPVPKNTRSGGSSASTRSRITGPVA